MLLRDPGFVITQREFENRIALSAARHEDSVARLSTVVVQRFCKPKVGGSNPSAGTNKSKT